MSGHSRYNLSGWNEDRSIVWVNEIFPDEVEEILVDKRYDPDDTNDQPVESDFDDDDDDVLQTSY